MSDSERKVLLAVREGRVDPRLLASALNLCRRLKAGMDILLIAEGERAPAQMDGFLDTLRQEGLPYTLRMRPTLRRRDIVDYANSHECITAVVIDSREGWEALAQDRASDPWRRLACPLVTAAPPKKRQAS